MADHHHNAGHSKKRTHATMTGADEPDVVQEDVSNNQAATRDFADDQTQVARPQAALTATHSNHTVPDPDITIPDQTDVLPATTQLANGDLAAITEDHKDDMNVDEVDREVVGEPIPKEGDQGTLVTGGEHEEDGAEAEAAADAEGNAEGTGIAEGNDDGQEVADGEQTVNDPANQSVSTYISLYPPLPTTTLLFLQTLLTPTQTSNAIVVPRRARQPGEWTPELRAMARRELCSVRRRMEREDRQAAEEWGDMLFAHAAAVAGREHREVVPGQADAEGEGEDEGEDEYQGD